MSKHHSASTEQTEVSESRSRTVPRANSEHSFSGNTHGPSEKDSALTQQHTSDDSLDGGYGWIVVTACMLINAHTWGIVSSFGVFLSHYLDDNDFPGATFLDYAFTGGLQIGACMATAPVATVSIAKFGTKTTLFIGVVLQFTCFMGASYASKIWHVLVSQGGGLGVSFGFLYIGSVGITPQWFSKRRSLANAIVAAGTGLGGLIYSLSINAMIERIGVGWALRILAIICAVVNTICTILVKDRNTQVGTVVLPWETKLWTRFEYVMFESWAFTSGIAFIMLVFSLPDYATSIGMTQKQASLIIALFNLAQVFGRPTMGYFSDSFGRLNMASLGTFLAGLFVLVIWTFSKSFGVLVFYALCGGSVSGVFWATVAPVAAEVVGLQHLPAALSMTWIVLVLPLTFSEPMALELALKTRPGFLSAQLFSGLLYILAASCVYCVRVWKVTHLKGRETGSVGVAKFERKDIFAVKKV